MVALVGAGCSAPLGYPTWTELVAQMAAKALEAYGANPNPTLLPPGWTIEDLSRRQAALASSPSPKTAHLLFAAGAYEKILKGENGASEAYEDFIRETFGGPCQAVDERAGPLESLLELPIRRFITTNYDVEIEAALRRKRKVSWRTFGIEEDGGEPRADYRSFTQEHERFQSQLALFALSGVSKVENWVFHCHGRFDRPASIIASEADYKRWYLSEELEGARAFQQTIELLLGSNPIFFVGYSLGDDELLQTLRLFATLEPQQYPAAPLFALLHRTEESLDDLEHAVLLERYGIQVLTFPAIGAAGSSGCEDGKGAEQTEKEREAETELRGRALQSALQTLERQWKQHHEQRDRKPAFRRVEVELNEDGSYVHSTIAECGGPRLAAKRVEEKVNDIWRAYDQPAAAGSTARSRVVVLHGHGGTGKSYLASAFCDAWAERRRQSNGRKSDGELGPFFFWSSYYSDDALTGVERLQFFLEAALKQARVHVPPPAIESRLERLQNLLIPAPKEDVPECLLVFDGLERLLAPSDVPSVGTPISQHVRDLLALLNHPRQRHRVLLTSRLVPDLSVEMPVSGQTSYVEAGPPLQLISLDRLRPDDLADATELVGLDGNERSALCSLLEGHAYAISLAVRWLGKSEQAEQKALLRRILHKLEAEAPSRRPIRMIEEAVDKVPSRELARAFLRNIALAMSPLDPGAVEICFDLARESVEKVREESGETTAPASEPTREQLTEELVEAGLVFRVRHAGSGPSGARRPLALTTHPTVRGYLFEPERSSPYDPLPNFTLAGFTSGTSVLHPGSKHAEETLRKTFEALIRAAESDDSDQARAAALGRAAFSIVRSRMEANTASRWCSYGDYASFGIRLIDLTVHLSRTHTWVHRAPFAPAEAPWPEAPLYADELAWLYNDLGLIFCAEGHMRDTLHLWEQGYEINRLIERSSTPTQYLVQSLLHLAHTYLELGQLDLAEEYLSETERANARFGDRDYSARIHGYRGLVLHLHGDLRKAELHYRRALKQLRAMKRNPRAEAIFSRHLADLLIKKDDLAGARELARDARALAETADYPELVAWARLCQGHLLRAEGDRPAARREYHATLAMARRRGIRRLEADALFELSRLALDQGDANTARSRALRALRLANQLGLGLRQTIGLVVLGHATLANGQRALGVAYLRRAWELARSQRYFLRAQEAERKLEELGEPPPREESEK